MHAGMAGHFRYCMLALTQNLANIKFVLSGLISLDLSRQHTFVDTVLWSGDDSIVCKLIESSNIELYVWVNNGKTMTFVLIMIIHCFQTSSKRRYHIIGCDNNVVSKSLHLDFGRPTIQRCSYNLKLYMEEADLLFKKN